MSKPTIKEAIEALNVKNFDSISSLALLEESDPVVIVENVAKALSTCLTVLLMAPAALEALGTTKDGHEAICLMVQSLEHALRVASKLMQEESSDDAEQPKQSRSRRAAETNSVAISPNGEAIGKLLSDMSYEVSKAINAWDLCQLLDYGVMTPDLEAWLSDPDCAKDDLMVNIGAHLKAAQAAYEKSLSAAA